MATMITFGHHCGAQVQRSNVAIQRDGWPECCGEELVKARHIRHIAGVDPPPEVGV